MEFKYSASTADGGLVTGLIASDSETAAERVLWDSGLTIIDLKRRIKLPEAHEALPSMFGVKKRDVIQFSRNVAGLLEAGIPILRALKIQSRFGKRAFRIVLEDVVKDVEEGNTLSEACAKHSAIFPMFYVYLLKTGEQVGNLSEVLRDTADHMEREEETRAKIKRSLAYPVFVLLLAVGAIFVMMAFVVPALTDLFAEFGSDLPPLTRGLIAVSDFFSANALYMVMVVVILGVVGAFYIRTPGGRYNKDRAVMKIPMVGPAVLKTGVARFCRNLSMLVGAGVSMFEALKLTSETTDNTVIAVSVREVYRRVGDGELLSEAVRGDELFPLLMGEMIGIGEESGGLEDQLSKVSGYYQEEADRAISQVTSMLTPVFTIGVGAVIGLIAVTIFSSIYSVVDVLPE